MGKRSLIRGFVLVVLISGMAFVATSVFGRDTDAPPIPEITPEGVLDVPHETADPEQVEDYKQEILDHLDRWVGDILSSPGWLHVVTSYDRSKDQASSLPSGQIIPADYIMDTWYFLNEESLVSKSVALMTDLEGRIIQESTFNDGIWRNLTVGESWTGDPYAIKLDFGFSKDISRPSQTSVVISHDTGELDGVPVDVYSIEDIFDYPVDMAGFDKAIIKGSRSVYFDLNKGALLKAERTLTAEDGSVYHVETAVFVTIEQAESPPDYILDHLGKK
jgi:hypothetical protein